MHLKTIGALQHLTLKRKVGLISNRLDREIKVKNLDPKKVIIMFPCRIL